LEFFGGFPGKAAIQGGAGDMSHFDLRVTTGGGDEMDCNLGPPGGLGQEWRDRAYPPGKGKVGRQKTGVSKAQ